ncbi:hypothetical protein Esi_0229_0047 [Ectocarpus siliculosus]|uniref:Uncharacterized protein n=1 Tax=Ectocarpus siliculosus TaxID=2880 RepID=D7FSA1_ECTSI|nr:hypothetical protein Esi_0229_0047 [Ectocarpus siliculosus]|eukprot:CBJ31042.1 hypothetical protein Esi_0229_0047 [Ectocarpus siliculosus]
MSPVRGGGRRGKGRGPASSLPEEAAAAGGNGGNPGPGSSGQRRPSRISSAIALASFNWTDDAIVEVARDLSNDPVAMYADSVPGKSSKTSGTGVGKASGHGTGAGGRSGGPGRAKAPHGGGFRPPQAAVSEHATPSPSPKVKQGSISRASPQTSRNPPQDLHSPAVPDMSSVAGGAAAGHGGGRAGSIGPVKPRRQRPSAPTKMPSRLSLSHYPGMSLSEWVQICLRQTVVPLTTMPAWWYRGYQPSGCTRAAMTGVLTTRWGIRGLREFRARGMGAEVFSCGGVAL